MKLPKVSSWTSTFVCLARTEQERAPTKSSEKEQLKIAGLGEKKYKSLMLIVAPVISIKYFLRPILN